MEKAYLGALDVVMQVVAQRVNQVNGILTGAGTCMPWEQHCNKKHASQRLDCNNTIHKQLYTIHNHVPRHDTKITAAHNLKSTWT